MKLTGKAPAAAPPDCFRNCRIKYDEVMTTKVAIGRCCCYLCYASERCTDDERLRARPALLLSLFLRRFLCSSSASSNSTAS